MIGAVSGSADGDRLTVAGNLLSVGSGTGFALKIVWSYDPAFAVAQTNVLATSEAGAFSAVVPVVPGTNGWWQAIATTTDGGYDATRPAAFATRGGSVLNGTASATVSHHTLTITAALDVLGAGETTVSVWAGDTPETMVEIDGSEKTLTGTGSFTVKATVAGDPRPVCWKVVSVNVAPGGTTWTSETRTFTTTTLDEGTYTWKTDVAAGDWDDPANWTVSGVPAGDCLGYPGHAKSTAAFASGTHAVVSVPTGTWTFVTLDISKNLLDLRFVGQGESGDDTTLYCNAWGADENNGAWTDWNVTFDNITLREENTISVGGYKTAQGVLAFENGAVYSFSGWQTVNGTNTWIVLKNGARMFYRGNQGDANGILLRNVDGGLVVDDATLTIPHLCYSRTNRARKQQFVLRGETAKATFGRYFRVYSESEDPMAADFEMVFSVPKERNAWKVASASTPLVGTYTKGTDATKPFAYRSTTNTVGKAVVTVDPQSEILKTGRNLKCVQLVEWTAEIDEKNVVLRSLPGKADVYYTYGSPSTRLDPLFEGEPPTGIAADLYGQGATVIMVK